MTPDTTFRASLEHHPRSSENHSLEKVTKSPNFSGGSGYSMAGAEGFEPSARGFGVAVEVYTLHKTSLVSQTLADLHRFTFRHSDAFLILLPPSKQRGGQILICYVKDRNGLLSGDYYWAFFSSSICWVWKPTVFSRPSTWSSKSSTRSSTISMASWGISFSSRLPNRSERALNFGPK